MLARCNAHRNMGAIATRAQCSEIAHAIRWRTHRLAYAIAAHCVAMQPVHRCIAAPLHRCALITIVPQTVGHSDGPTVCVYEMQDR
jgi:hypothetical protein